MWKIIVDKDNIKLSSCNCPAFYKRYVCKHLLGTLIRLKLITPPLAAKNQPIGITRGVGRPRKATKALYFQPEHYNALTNDDSSDDNAEDTLDELETETRASTNPNISDDDGTDDDVDEAAFEEVIVAPVLIPPRAIRKRRGGEVVRGRVRGGGRGRGRPIVVEAIEVVVAAAPIIAAPRAIVGRRTALTINPEVIVRGGRAVGRGRGSRRRVFSESIEVPLAEIIEAPVPTAVVQLRRGRSSKQL